MLSESEREERYSKKVRRVAVNSAWATGIGVGAFIARLIAPLFAGDSESMNAIFTGVGTLLVGYGIAQFACIIFLRKKAVLISSLLTYFVMPALFIKFWMDTMS